MSADRPPDSEPEPEPDMYTRPLGAGIDFSNPNSRLAPFYFGASGVLTTVVLTAVLLFFSFAPLNHTDIWVHLKYGERIVETKQLPETEPLSPFTDKQQKLVNVQWLSQVVYHLAFRVGEVLTRGGSPESKWLGGAEALRVLHALAVTAFIGLMALAVRRASGSSPLAVGTAALITVLVVLSIGVHRPQTFGLVCFAAVLAVVSRPDLPRRVVWQLPLVMTVWANLHGSFAVGFVLLGVLLVGRAIDAARAGGVKGTIADAGVRRLALGTLLAVVAAAVVNPYGPKLFLAVLTFGSNPNLKTLVEWTPLRLTEPSRGALIYWFLVIGNLLAFGIGFRSVSLIRLLTAFAFAIPPLLQQRMIVWWVPVGVWAMAAQFGAIATRAQWTVPSLVPSFKFTLLSALFVIPAVLLTPASSWIQRGEPATTAVHAGTPVELVAVLRDPAADPGERMRPLATFLRQHYAGRTGGPVFGAEGVSEFLIWADPPGYPPFFFTHAHLFTPEHWRDSQTVLNGEPGWREILDRAGVNVVAVEPDIRGQLAGRISRDPDWQVVLNEAGSATRKDVRARLFVAVRKQPK